MIELTHEEWFKIYMVLDNLPVGEYNKNFLMMAEYWKDKIYDTMMVYVSAVESQYYNLDSDIHEYRSQYSEATSEEEKSTLREKYKNLDKEYNAVSHEIHSIMNSVIPLEGVRIPKSIVEIEDDEMLEVLKMVMEGDDE